ncbi:MAG: orotidine-5'-phosphate decarboxylase [Candidatus Dormibacteria bacterium]
MSSITTPEGAAYHERLEESRRRRDSFLCVGLDPDPSHPLLAAMSPSAVVEWLLELVSATAPYACCFKPQSAFFESFGREGWGMLRAVIEAVPAESPVILDAKRGDIGSTARAYASAAFQSLGAAAITVNPYLGRDSLEPFFEWPDRGVYVLARTSNPGAADFQGAELDGEPLYLAVARRVAEWAPVNGALVVGATAPDELARVRAVAPAAELLLPGVGAQGGDVAAAVRAAGGRRFVINASRSILFASTGRDFARAAGQAARALRDEINSALA